MAEWKNVGRIQGEQGPEGPQGIQGPEGPRGPKGDTGDSGIAETGGNLTSGYYVKYNNGMFELYVSGFELTTITATYYVYSMFSIPSAINVDNTNYMVTTTINGDGSFPTREINHVYIRDKHQNEMRIQAHCREALSEGDNVQVDVHVVGQWK